MNTNKFIEERLKEFEGKFATLVRREPTPNRARTDDFTDIHMVGFLDKYGRMTCHDSEIIKKYLSQALSDAIKYGEVVGAKKYKELKYKIDCDEEQIRVAEKYPTDTEQFYNALDREKAKLAKLKIQLTELTTLEGEKKE